MRALRHPHLFEISAIANQFASQRLLTSATPFLISPNGGANANKFALLSASSYIRLSSNLFLKFYMHTDKTLGVLGGMGPAATADFLRVLAEVTPAETDQEHPRMIVYSHTVTPDRTTFILGKGPDPTEYIKDGLKTLIGWGADLLCVTCNTAHYFIDQFRDEISKPIVHIIDETIGEAASRSPQGAWLTATLGTMRTGLYQRHAQNSGYAFRIPSEPMQVEIHDVTDMVKAGKHKEAGEKFKKIVEQLWEIERLPIVGACTEIPIAYANTGLDPKMGISCLEALAKGCVRVLYYK